MQNKDNDLELLAVEELENVQGGGDSIFFDRVKEVVANIIDNIIGNW